MASAIAARRELERRRRESERLTAQELEIAKQVQARLLPQRLPKFPTLDCAGICIQARAVGGDYYDFLELSQNRIAIIVGDVSGKGIAASLLMANLQAIVRSQVAAFCGDARRTLSLVNRTVFENTEPHAYATLFYSEYDREAGQLRYSNCGHLPGLLLRETEVHRLNSTGTVVGLFNQWDCELSETALLKGDTLLLYTGGVTEAFDGTGEEFGESRLVELLHNSRHLDAQSLAETIVRQVIRYGGPEQRDDITVVVVKKNA